MLFNKYALNDEEFILYGEKFDPAPEETFNLKLIEKDVSLKDNDNIPIYSYDDMFSFVILKGASRDKRLERNGIVTFLDLAKEYALVKLKQSKQSRSIRNDVLCKYTELIDYYV